MFADEWRMIVVVQRTREAAVAAHVREMLNTERLLLLLQTSPVHERQRKSARKLGVSVFSVISRVIWD